MKNYVAYYTGALLLGIATAAAHIYPNSIHFWMIWISSMIMTMSGRNLFR